MTSRDRPGLAMHGMFRARASVEEYSTVVDLPYMLWFLVRTLLGQARGIQVRRVHCFPSIVNAFRALPFRLQGLRLQ